MKVTLGRCRFGRLVALAVLIALVPLPAFAADGPPDTSASPGIRVSAATIAKVAPLAANSSPAVQNAPPAGTDSSSFFKRPAGVITLALVGAGLGYALYSTKNDRVKSPAR